MAIVLLWIICILCIVFPPLGIIMFIGVLIYNFGSQKARDNYCDDTAQYYKRRKWYFKKYYGQ